MMNLHKRKANDFHPHGCPVPTPILGPLHFPDSLDPASTLQRGENHSFPCVRRVVTEPVCLCFSFSSSAGRPATRYPESTLTGEVSEKLGLRLVTGFAARATRSSDTSGVLTHILCPPELWDQRGT